MDITLMGTDYVHNALSSLSVEIERPAFAWRRTFPSIMQIKPFRPLEPPPARGMPIFDRPSN